MYTTLLFSLLFALSLAAPLAVDEWTPAPNSVVKCDKAADKNIGFSQGLLLETVLTKACSAMIPCAYPNRPSDMVCAATIDIPLNAQETSIQHANIQTSDGNKISGWDVQFAVTPLLQESATGVRWRKEDCYGYFEYMLNTWEPEGCHGSKGSGIGSMVVGGDSSLKGTVFEVSIVPQAWA